MMRPVRAWVALALATAAAGCGQMLLAGGQRGEVRAVATDDATAPSNGASAARFALAPEPGSAAALVPQGTLRVEGAVVLVGSGGEAVPLSDGIRGGTLRIAAADSVLLGRDSVLVGRYTRARVTLTRVEAEVTGGLLVGGLPLVGSVRVPLAEPLVIEAPIDLRVSANSSETLVVDLNAAVWLLQADPLARTVPVTALQGAVEVRVR